MDYKGMFTKEYWDQWFGKLGSLAVSVKVLMSLIILGTSTKMLMMKLLTSGDYAKIVLGVISIIAIREVVKVDMVGKVKNVIGKVINKDVGN